MPLPQNEDGTPHFTYFDKPTQLSFVWDGSTPYIEVSHGGYGEPMMDKLPVPDRLREGGTKPRWALEDFAALCDGYVAQHKQEWLDTPGLAAYPDQDD